MARRNQGAAPSPRAIEAQELGKTARTAARWDGLKKILPAFFASASPVGLAIVEAQAGGPSVVNIVLIILMIIIVPTASIKIIYDGVQKKRLRSRTTELEQENRTLKAQLDEVGALPRPREEQRD